jgi:hypothetical protein
MSGFVVSCSDCVVGWDRYCKAILVGWACDISGQISSFSNWTTASG